MIIHCLHDRLEAPTALKQHPKNRNAHSPAQIDRLAKILAYQGWRYPIKISKLSGYITSGHGRLHAALQNKWKEVPVVYQDYESDEQEYADLQSDNAIAAWAELDLASINSDLADLGPDFDLDMLGIKNFVLDLSDTFEETIKEEAEKKYLIEVQFPNDMEMNDIKGDLLNRGYIVKVK